MAHRHSNVDQKSAHFMCVFFFFKKKSRFAAFLVALPDALSACLARPDALWFVSMFHDKADSAHRRSVTICRAAFYLNCRCFKCIAPGVTSRVANFQRCSMLVSIGLNRDLNFGLSGDEPPVRSGLVLRRPPARQSFLSQPWKTTPAIDCLCNRLRLACLS